MVTAKHAGPELPCCGNLDGRSARFADRVPLGTALRAEDTANADIFSVGRQPRRLGRMTLAALGACGLGCPARTAVIRADRRIGRPEKL